MKKLLLIFIVFLMFDVGFAQVNTEVKQFFSQALNQNRTVYVYRPDSTVYPDPLPVMIYLPGWNVSPSSMPVLRSELESLLNSGTVEPMLIVIPDGSGGIYTRSIYWNSPGVNGNYGDYIAIETVNFVNNTYNVIQGSGQTHMREVFIIGGFSMGGGGAVRVGYNWGDVFSGIVSFSGDIDHRSLFDSFVINSINSQARQNPPGSGNIIYTPPSQSYAFEYAFWGYASAITPDTTAQYLCQFPLNEGDGSIIDSVRTKWLEAGPVHTAGIHYQSYTQASMNLFFAVDPNDPWYAGPMTQSFVNWITQNYSQVPLVYHTHSSGHSMPTSLVDSMLIWADTHFKNVTSGMDDLKNSNVKNYELFQNYPNPFNHSTTINFKLHKKDKVKIEVFNMLGQSIKTLLNRQFPAGSHAIKFVAKDLPSGVYLYRINIRNFQETKKMLFLR